MSKSSSFSTEEKESTYRAGPADSHKSICCHGPGAGRRPGRAACDKEWCRFVSRAPRIVTGGFFGYILDMRSGIGNRNGAR